MVQPPHVNFLIKKRTLTLKKKNFCFKLLGIMNFEPIVGLAEGVRGGNSLSIVTGG